MASVLREKLAQYKDFMEFSEHRVPLAIKNKKLVLAQKLIELGLKFKPYNSNRYPWTSNLHLAVRYANVEIIETIVEKGFSLDMKDKNGLLPLSCLALRDQVDEECEKILDYFSKKGIHIDSTEPDTGFSLLHYAVKENNVDIIKLLLKRKCNLNTKSLAGLTPLHIAVMNELPELVSLLLVSGAVHNIKDIKNRTPMSLAIDNENKEIIQILFSLDLDFKNMRGIESSVLHDNFTLCYCATIMGLSEMVKRSLLGIANIDQFFFRTGKTLLHAAAENGHDNIVLMLLTKGADPNIPLNHGESNCATPLHLAARNGHVEVVSLLVGFNASAKCSDCLGKTPLFVAAEGGCVDVVKCLLNSNCPLSYMYIPAYSDCRTPIYGAIDEGHVDVVNLFLERGISPIYFDSNGLTPLHMAVKKNNIQIARALVQKGVNIDSEKSIPFLNYALDGTVDEKMMKFIISLGVNLEARNKQGLTPLESLLVKKDQSHLVQLLLDNGADVNYINESTNVSAVNLAYADISLLILYGLDIHTLDNSGNPIYKKIFSEIQSRVSVRWLNCDLSNFDTFSPVDPELSDPIFFKTLFPALRAMTEHLARLKATETYLDVENLRILYSPFVKIHYRLCTQELDRLQRCEIETGIPCYTLITARDSNIPYRETKKVMTAFEETNIFNSFSIYAKHLRALVELRMKMKITTDKCIDLMIEKLGLPMLAADTVISNLNDSDIRKFCIACEPIYKDK